MSRTLFRSALELRTRATRSSAPQPHLSFLPTAHVRRNFNSTAPIVEPSSSIASQASASPPTRSDQVPRAVPKSPEILYPRPAAPSTPAPISDSVRALLPLLAAQPSHYITFHIHGRPYLVQPGDHVRLPFRMPGVVPGDVLRLDRASVIGSRDFTLKGSPFIDDRLFECRAVVTGSELEPVRVKVKTKRRQRRAKQVKSQHRFTTLAISELKVKELDEVEG